MRLRLSLVVLILASLVSGSAFAVTANLCVRNDGVGTFEMGDLAVFADSDWNAGDRTDSMPGSSWQSIAPGGTHCEAITGLYQWNGSQYQYRFDITFEDTYGNVTVSSPSNRRWPSRAKTW